VFVCQITPAMSSDAVVPPVATLASLPRGKRLAVAIALFAVASLATAYVWCDQERLDRVITVIDSTNGFHDGVNGPATSADDRYLGLLADGGACTTDAQCIAAYGANALCDSTTLIAASVCSLMGVGRGQMRLYADSTGAIQGHTWSPNYDSTYYPRPSPLPTRGGTLPGRTWSSGGTTAE